MLGVTRRGEGPLPRIVLALLLALSLACAHAAEKVKPAKQQRAVSRTAESGPVLRAGLTASSPLHVKAVPTDPTPEERARRIEEQQERAERLTLERRLLRESQRIANYTAALAVAGIALFLLAGALLAVALLHVRASRRAASSAEETARSMQASAVAAQQASERQLRAYVLLLKAIPDIRGQDFVVTLIFKNYGQTPAMKARAVANLAIWKVDEPFVPAEITVEQANGALSTVGPGGHMDTTNRLTRPAWQMTLQQELDAGITRGHVYGKVFYEDAFGNEWTTTFQLVLARDSNNRWMLATANEGNAAT
jgi:hypothetical protein